MSRRTYNKLIRDKIPEVNKENGGVPKISILQEADFRKALKIKIKEEVKELMKAEIEDKVLNELSDIQESIRAIAENYGILMEKIEKHKEKKLQERGGFKKKLFLKYVDISDK